MGVISKRCNVVGAVEVPPLPVPNLGYACLNSTLQSEKPPVTTNRGAILRTYNEKGLVYISQLALQNCKDLLPIVQWNHEHSIRLFRYVHLLRPIFELMQSCITYPSHVTPVDAHHMYHVMQGSV